MMKPHEQLDRRFETLRPLAAASKPARGWIKAIREALGMTTAQLGERMGVKQPRIAELETNETKGNITLKSLERAAEAMGCRVVYMLMPVEPLGDTLRARAAKVAEQQLNATDQTMKLEDQGVQNAVQRARLREQIIDQLLERPARLWDTK